MRCLRAFLVECAKRDAAQLDPCVLKVLSCFPAVLQEHDYASRYYGSFGASRAPQPVAAGPPGAPPMAAQPPAAQGGYAYPAQGYYANAGGAYQVRFDGCQAIYLNYIQAGDDTRTCFTL